MNMRFLVDTFGWGFLLWLMGYVLGIIFYMVVPPAMVGWAIMPMGSVITVWALWRKIKGGSGRYYLWLAVVWTLLAIVLDYFFLVKLFKPMDGYYKLDVYLYYLLMFVLPLVIGRIRKYK